MAFMPHGLLVLLLIHRFCQSYVLRAKAIAFLRRQKLKYTQVRCMVGLSVFAVHIKLCIQGLPRILKDW